MTAAAHPIPWTLPDATQHQTTLAVCTDKNSVSTAWMLMLLGAYCQHHSSWITLRGIG